MVWRVWLVVVLAASCVRGQLLDLDAGSAPEPGTGKAALRLADSIEDGLEDTEPTDASGACSAAFRRVAVALLRTGEDAGEDGSYRVVVGRTIARRLDDIDARLGDELEQIGSGGLDRVIADLDSIAADVPAGNDELDRRLRDALAPLLLDERLDAHAGWWDRTPDQSSLPVDEWIEAGLISDETGTSLRGFDALLGEAMAQPGYTRSASAIRLELVGGGRAMLSLPDWIGEETRTTLWREFDAGVRALVDSSGHERERLNNLGMGVTIVRTIDGLGAREGRAARAGVQDAIAEYARASDTGAFEAAWALWGAFFGLDEPEDGSVRALRPATRGLGPRVREVRTQLVDLLERALAGEVKATDPALVGAVSSRRELGKGIAAIGRLESELSPRGDERDKWRERVAGSLLPVTRRVGEESQRDAALGELESLADLLDDRDSVRALADTLDAPGERETVWDHLCDGRRAALAGMLRRAADEWDEGWADPRSATPGDELNERVRVLARHAGLIRDFFTIRTIVGFSEHSEGGSALERWAGWELSTDALRRLAVPLEERLNQATAALLDGDDELHLRLLQLVERDAGLVRLVARLEREARAMGQPQEAQVGPFMELGLGAPTPGAWRADWRSDLASVCRYAEEWSEAERIEDRERAARFGEFVRAQAARVLGALEE